MTLLEALFAGIRKVRETNLGTGAAVTAVWPRLRRNLSDAILDDLAKEAYGNRLTANLTAGTPLPEDETTPLPQPKAPGKSHTDLPGIAAILRILHNTRYVIDGNSRPLFEFTRVDIAECRLRDERLRDSMGHRITDFWDMVDKLMVEHHATRIGDLPTKLAEKVALTWRDVKAGIAVAEDALEVEEVA